MPRGHRRRQVDIRYTEGAGVRKNRAVADRLVQALVLVDDLVTARSHMETAGFTVLEGGHHPGRGTANVIVPFGNQYLELLAVVDAREALASAQGRPIMTALSTRGRGLARWSVEPEDIEGTANVRTARGATVPLLPTGETVRWRAVGVDVSWIEPWRCAFMAWDDPDQYPGRSERTHPNGATGFSRLEVATADRAALVGWLGGKVPNGVHLSVAAGARARSGSSSRLRPVRYRLLRSAGSNSREGALTGGLTGPHRGDRPRAPRSYTLVMDDQKPPRLVGDERETVHGCSNTSGGRSSGRSPESTTMRPDEVLLAVARPSCGW